MSNITPEGPFPQSGRNDELQRESLVALAAALPKDRFRIRDERAEDFGVDCSIELLVNGNNLNMRSQVQLKSTDSEEVNSDGSYSLKIDTSNFNYILNGPAPLYVVHLNKLGKLRFAWARDEYVRISETNSEWMNQTTITLRFSKDLDSSAIDEIAIRIYNEARFFRNLITMVLNASSATSVTIDPATLSVQSPLQALQVLENNGINLVSQGDSRFVLELFAKASPAATSSALANLSVGYALVILGRYSEAIGHLAKYRMNQKEASLEVDELAIYLKAVSDYHLGRIERAELLNQLRSLAKDADTEFTLFLALDAARLEAFESGFSDVTSIVAAIEAIENSKIASETLRYQARLQKLTLKGLDVARHVTTVLSVISSRNKMGIPSKSVEELQALNQEINEWELSFWDELQCAGPRLTNGARADALSIRLQVRFMTCLALQTFFPSTDTDVLKMVEGDLKEASKLYSDSGIVEGELRIQALHANFLELESRDDEAKAIAANVLDTANIIGFRAMSEEATNLLNGNSAVGNLRKARQRISDVDEDLRILEMDENNFVDTLSTHALTSLSLPDDRLAQLREEARSIYQGAHLRVYWCRHAEILQDQSHLSSPMTRYRDPLRFKCKCIIKDILATHEGNVIESTIASFKTEHCDICELRSPKCKT